jgi:hypothetical protein
MIEELRPGQYTEKLKPQKPTAKRKSQPVPPVQPAEAKEEPVAEETGQEDPADQEAAPVTEKEAEPQS